MSRWLRIIVVTLLAAGLWRVGVAARSNDAPSPAYDHLLLSLSWSPEFCASNPKQNQSEQCRRAYGWVLHGLWPQYQKGAPQYCRVDSTWLPAEIIQHYQELFPSKSLMIHQWKKYGSCFSSTAQPYFSTTAQLMTQVRSWIPSAMKQPTQAQKVSVATIKQWFAETARQQGATLTPDSMALFCADGGRYLRELRLCFNQALAPIACSQETSNRAAKSCAQPSFIIRPF